MRGGCISEVNIPCVRGSVVEEVQIAHGVDDDEKVLCSARDADALLV